MGWQRVDSPSPARGRSSDRAAHTPPDSASFLQGWVGWKRGVWGEVQGLQAPATVTLLVRRLQAIVLHPGTHRPTLKDAGLSADPPRRHLAFIYSAFTVPIQRYNESHSELHL